MGRRRRRRRRRRDRPFGDDLLRDAPQPADDGLAVVAEIGGDLVASTGDAGALDRRGPRSAEERHRRSRGSRGGRNRFRQADGEATPETLAAGFDSPPSVALEEEFAGSEADYSVAPSSIEAVPPEGTAGKSSPVATAEGHGIEPQEAAAQAPTSASSATEPPRPRRSGWWQRARATVIGK